ncbi:MAG: DNA-processing protein DprA [Candidatus Shapirobacteria bacterium]|nr:DNA-processing protein DprA [Candidatus Shapirobacteria bacterium]
MLQTVEIGIKDKRFPELLREIPDCPGKLFCLGNIELLKENKKIAVVGSRQMSWYGQSMMRNLVPELVRNNWVIVSGMALGIDAEAHKICLENKGKTIAVLASGVNIISPKSNEYIYQNILKNGGLIVSEYKDNTLIQNVNFLRRNRIISGMSLGVLVVEGSQRSGSLVTAKMALEQGREVMAVPGRISDENSFTPNFLIKNGGLLVMNADDILKNLKL